jgi:hypothetical protein
MIKKIIFSLFISSNFFIYSQVEILSENFQSGIPSNWTIVNNDQLNVVDNQFSNAWTAIIDPENSLDTIVGSTSYFSPIGTADRWLITPTLTLGNYGNYISWKSKSHDASFPDNYAVKISNSGTDISNFTNTLIQITGESFEWVTRSIDLSGAGYSSQNVNIAFVNNTNNGFKLYLDSIIVTKEDPVQLFELNTTNFSVFPNPSTNQITINSSFEINQIAILNNSGQRLIVTKNTHIDISELSTGIYYVEVIMNGEKQTKKIVKL